MSRTLEPSRAAPLTPHPHGQLRALSYSSGFPAAPVTGRTPDTATTIAQPGVHCRHIFSEAPRAVKNAGYVRARLRIRLAPLATMMKMAAPASRSAVGLFVMATMTAETMTRPFTLMSLAVNIQLAWK